MTEQQQQVALLLCYQLIDSGDADCVFMTKWLPQNRVTTQTKLLCYYIDSANIWSALRAVRRTIAPERWQPFIGRLKR